MQLSTGGGYLLTRPSLSLYQRFSFCFVCTSSSTSPSSSPSSFLSHLALPCGRNEGITTKMAQHARMNMSGDEGESDVEVTLESIDEKHTMYLPLRANYSWTWGPVEAFRELLQNWYNQCPGSCHRSSLYR